MLFVKALERKKFVELKYVITETGRANSYDPLNADKTQNLPVMRMMYLTPLEVDSNNSLTSTILSSFLYDSETNEIVFVVKEDVFFQDGTRILPTDIEMSIKRMAYFRPDFPIIRDIVGVHDWSKQKLGLRGSPSGIKITGNKIILKLSKKKLNPLFRFCLELFSIVPSKCINLDSGILVCELPPESGYYKIESAGPKNILFRKRMAMKDAHPFEGFDKVLFEYKTVDEACNSEIGQNTIISANEVDLKSNAICEKNLKSAKIHWLPSSRFGILRFNPNIAPFHIRECRVTFANEVRNVLKSNQANLEVESSLFTKLLPGFLSEETLAETSSKECLIHFHKKQINLAKTKNPGATIIADAIIVAAKNLGMDINEVSYSNPDLLVDKFLTGYVPVVAGASGFWAQDPIGDMVMWFTPNLHKTMSFVWHDEHLYSLINELDQESDETRQRSNAEKLNKYILKQSVISPVVHFRRLYVTNKEQSAISLPQAIISPAPWQILPLDR